MTLTMKLDQQELRIQHARELKDESDAALALSEQAIKNAVGCAEYPVLKLDMLRDAEAHTARARRLWQEAMDLLT